MKLCCSVLCISFSIVGFSADYSKWIQKYSKLYNVRSDVVEAIIYVESSKRHWVTGDDGKSLGLMQIQLPTARDEGFRGSREELMYPYYNIKYGTKYLSTCIAWAGGDVWKGVDIYNRGIKNVMDHPYRGDWSKHRHVGKVYEYIYGKTVK